MQYFKSTYVYPSFRQRNNIEKKIILGGKRKTTKRQKHKQATTLIETGPILEAFLPHKCATKVTHLVSRKFEILLAKLKKLSRVYDRIGAHLCLQLRTLSWNSAQAVTIVQTRRVQVSGKLTKTIWYLTMSLHPKLHCLHKFAWQVRWRYFVTESTVEYRIWFMTRPLDEVSITCHAYICEHKVLGLDVAGATDVCGGFLNSRELTQRRRRI